MFDKKNDTCLKIVNLVLIVIAVLSLGVAIGNNYYDTNSLMSCSTVMFGGIDDISIQAEADFEASCNYAKSVSEDESKKNMYVGYSIFITSITGLVISNLFSKKSEKK